MLFQDLFTGSTEEIKDSNRGDWIPGDDLHIINNGLKELTGSGHIDLAIKDDSTYTENLELNDLLIYEGGRLNAPGYTIIVRGNLIGRNARIVCDTLIVWGDIDFTRKTGDMSYTNIFDVNEVLCLGNMLVDYSEWTPARRYEGVGPTTASTIIQKIGGNLTVTNDQTSNAVWFVSQVSVGGNFYCDSATIVNAEFKTVEKSFLWTVDGDCEFDGLTALTFLDCYLSPMFSVGGELIFSEGSVTWDLSGSIGNNGGAPGVGNYGGGFIGGEDIGAGTGDPGLWNGGGSGGSHISIARLGGAGAGRGGDGGSTAGGGGAGAGGGGSPNFMFFYGLGDTNTTLNIILKGGDGGDAYVSGVNSDGGDGGDSGTLTISYDTTPMNVLNMDVTGSNGGAGDTTGSPGANGSVGSASHTPGGSPLPYHLPVTPTFVTAEDAETTTIEFNVPVDMNGSDLDFEVILEQKITETVWLTAYVHNSNANPSMFSGTAPYTEGTGTVVYTPPVLPADTYRISIKAMKDSATNLSSINQAWLTFTYP